MLRIWVAGALLGATSCSAFAAVAEKELEPVAEAAAIASVCDELTIANDQFFGLMGISEKDFSAGGGGAVADFVVMRAAEYERDLKTLRVDGVCARGRYFYGPEGTKVPGLLQPKKY